jgi:type I restriction enzyme M protein
MTKSSHKYKTAEEFETAGYIQDYITNEYIPGKPENIEAKVVFEERLYKEYGYDLNQMQPEFKIQKGSALIGPADIVVFRDGKDKTQDNIYIVVECKRKERTDGIQQLKTYLAPLPAAKYGVWFNGVETVYIKKLDKAPHFKFVPNISKKGETLELPKKSELKPATELKSVFQMCHNYIYANEGFLKEKVFNEVLKILFLKIVDEKDYSSPIAKFGITEEENDLLIEGKGDTFLTRMEELFKEVKKRYGDVFTSDERINLKSVTLGFVVGQLMYFDLRRTPADVKGIAFQTFVYAHQRGERGEFFTPEPIVKLIVEMLNPKSNEMVLDPACGSGGFLVTAMKHVWKQLEGKIKDTAELKEAQLSYAVDNIRGMDFNPDLAKVSKMRMVLEDDGHTGVFSENALEAFETISKTAHEMGATKVRKGRFDVVLTNLPFGTKGKVTNREILSNFDLGHKWKFNKETGYWEKESRLLDGQVPDILFIERCLDYLDDRGRMGIVIPDGDLTNSTLGYLREWIKNKARILAVVSLPQETFIPHGAGVKASVLFLQKLPPKELAKIKDADYPVFMGIIEKIGYDVRGKKICKRNERGEMINDEGDVVYKPEDAATDEDVSKVIGAFKEFKRRHKLGF